MVAQVTGLRAKDFVHTIGDAHLYVNHLEQVEEQMGQEPGPLPTLWLNPDVVEIDKFELPDVEVRDDVAAPTIRAPIAV